jgi:tRNA-uridine 2-sulfurtransferase
MSQHRGALTLVARESGFADLIVRPLSARLLPPTKPELSGWVDREKLLDLSGRGRKRQMALAAHYGITEYPAPAGGCLLTDPGFSARLKELLRHTEQVSRRDLELLKWGRHFRLPGGKKAIVGRTQKENEAIAALTAPGDLICRVQNVPGPTVIMAGGAGEAEGETAAALAAAYSDVPEGAAVAVNCSQDGEPRVFHPVTPPKERFKDWLI